MNSGVKPETIDLMDEAGSRLRIEIDSMPQEIDEVDRRVAQAVHVERRVLPHPRQALAVQRDEQRRAAAALVRQRPLPRMRRLRV